MATYVSLDEAPAHAAAYTDPAGFLSRFEGPVILDEIQRAPALFLAIEVQVDRARIPGRFLLTASSDILLLPRLADALPGRMEILTLWPLSQGEIEGLREGLIDVLFSERLPVLPRGRAVGVELWERIVRGGLPEAQALAEPRRREAWFGSYLTTILQRDVRDVSNVAGLTELPRLLALLAARGGALLNAAEVSSSSGLPWNTLRRYMALLQGAFLVQTVPACSGGQGVGDRGARRLPGAQGPGEPGWGEVLAGRRAVLTLSACPMDTVVGRRDALDPGIPVGRRERRAHRPARSLSGRSRGGALRQPAGAARPGWASPRVRTEPRRALPLRRVCVA